MGSKKYKEKSKGKKTANRSLKTSVAINTSKKASIARAARYGISANFPKVDLQQHYSITGSPKHLS